jgi:hypothetical protein
MKRISLINLITVCLAFLVVGPFAGSALAQDDEVGPDTVLQNRILHEMAAAKASQPTASPTVNAQQQKSGAVTPNSTTACAFNFTTGSGQTLLKFCVTVNGNIVQFQSPAGVEQIAQGTFGEGYQICDGTTSVAYFDYAGFGDSGNWNAPITLSSSTTQVKIQRTTADGAWTLTQTIAKVGGMNPYAKITMALKNNSGTTKFAELIRYADSDPGQASSTSSFSQSLDGGVDSAWAYVPYSDTSGNSNNGLMLQIVGNPAPTSVPFGRLGFAQNTPFGPPACAAFTNFVSPVTNTDGSIVYFYDFDITHGQTVTVNERYISF